MKRSSIRFDLLLAAMLSVFAALVRAPYLALIPRFEDEVLQTVYALSIGPGEPLPLAGADAYSGPLFTYLIAAGLRVFGSTPVTPRIVVLILGALTAGMTYWLARAVGLKWPWAALAGLLLAANPLHIVVNSHHAASTVILPLFSTAFLAALALAARRKSGRWLVVAGALLGLAGQANPVIALMLPGVIVWFLTQHGQNASIGLRTRWPYLAAAVCLAAYAPVIVYNIQNELLSVHIGTGQVYVWQPNLSLPAFAENLGRLMLQLGRQMSGVLEGDESLKGLIGMPILLSAWALAGLIYTARRGMSLLAFAVGSQALIMPWVTDYYGMVIRTRFTSPLTPLMTVAMGALAAGLWALASERLRDFSFARTMRWLAVVLLATLSLWPLTSLLRYYEDSVARGETNAPDLAFIDELLRQWRGERILLSESLGRFNSTEYLLAVHRVPYSLMPLGRIMERLATGQETGPVILILDKDDLSPARAQADLIAWDSPAMRAVYKMGYGAYTIADARQVRKPTFVFTDTTLGPTLHAVQVNLANQLGVIGYEIKPERPKPGGELVVNVHWLALAAMPKVYTSFLHLVGPDGRLITQDDHELGRGFYRTLYWQPGEVVREKYTLALPKEISTGEYTLRVGVYDFPSLERLAVLSSNIPTQDNAVTLGTVHVGP
jgi:4-amino-4-deoxy-L-arabinose transferase-like glycosyltransferase